LRQMTRFCFYNFHKNTSQKLYRKRRIKATESIEIAGGMV